MVKKLTVISSGWVGGWVGEGGRDELGLSDMLISEEGKGATGISCGLGAASALISIWSALFLSRAVFGVCTVHLLAYYQVEGSERQSLSGAVEKWNSWTLWDWTKWSSWSWVCLTGMVLVSGSGFTCCMGEGGGHGIILCLHSTFVFMAYLCRRYQLIQHWVCEGAFLLNALLLSILHNLHAVPAESIPASNHRKSWQDLW